MTTLKKITAGGIVFLLISVKTSCTSTASMPSNEKAAVDSVLDDFHSAASEADGKRYFGHFTADAVFFGTDATERWPIEQFRAYAGKYFDQGKGWTYRATERNIFFADDAKTSWFDERLENENYGECRGTGVLRKQDGQWKIAQYNLTIPIPNAIARDVVNMIRKLPEAKN